MITIKQVGNFKKTEKFLKGVSLSKYTEIFKKYGRMGVEALSTATPIATGATAASWNYRLSTTSKGVTIVWTNSNIVNGVSIAILIQYGHGTNNGGYVQGRDYINPAIRPIFDKITNDIWKEVKAL